MRISINNIWLTNDGLTDLQSWTDAHDVLLNGKQIVQDAQFLRAAAAQPMARGNAVNTVQFSVTRQHPTVADAAAYVLTVFSSLPAEGPAVVICGATGEGLVTCTFDAVLEAITKATFSGTRSDVTFLLRGGAITTGAVLSASAVDGTTFATTYAYPQGGTIDGGNLADVLDDAELTLDGGSLT